MRRSSSRGTSSQVTQRYTPAAGDQFAYTIDNRGGMSAENLATLRSSLVDQLRTARLLAASPLSAARRVTITINEYCMRPRRRARDLDSRSIASLNPETESCKFTLSLCDTDACMIIL